jgi:hypothetical protein
MKKMFCIIMKKDTIYSFLKNTKKMTKNIYYCFRLFFKKKLQNKAKVEHFLGKTVGHVAFHSYYMEKC